MAIQNSINGNSLTLKTNVLAIDEQIIPFAFLPLVLFLFMALNECFSMTIEQFVCLINYLKEMDLEGSGSNPMSHA